MKQVPNNTNSENYLFEQIQIKVRKLSQLSWKIYKNYGHVQVYEQLDNHELLIKGEWRFHQSLDVIKQILSQEQLMTQYQPFLVNISQIGEKEYQTLYSFTKKNQKLQLNFKYVKHMKDTKDCLIIVKEYLPFEKKQHVLNVQFYKLLDKEIVTCIVDKKNPMHSLCQIIINCGQLVSKIQKSFFKEYIINYSIINHEIHSIQYMKEEKQEEELVPQSLSSYFIPNDRDGYKDEKKDHHIAFKYVEFHDRIKQLDEEELQAFTTFKEMMQDYGLNDNSLIRHLQARWFDLEICKEFLKEVYEWRKTNKINELYNQDFSFFERQKILISLGEGKVSKSILLKQMGNPILFINAQNVFPDKFEKNGHNTLDKFIEYFCYKMEMHTRSMRANIDWQILVIDCENLSRKNVSVELIKKLIGFVFKNYPERMMRNIVINGGWLSNTIFKMVKQFLTYRTLQKMAFAGTDVKEIFEVLGRDIDKEVIPRKYGGLNDII